MTSASILKDLACSFFIEDQRIEIHFLDLIILRTQLAQSHQGACQRFLVRRAHAPDRVQNLLCVS